MLCSLLLTRSIDAAPLNYEAIYGKRGMQGDWKPAFWQDNDGQIVTTLDASAPGRTEKAINVRYELPGGYGAFGFVDRTEDWDRHLKYLNEFETVEFDIYFEPDSAGADELYFILEDAYLSDEPRIVDLIPGWDALSNSEKQGKWFHVKVDLSAIHPTISSFSGFVLFNAGTSHPHFRLADVKLGWSEDTSPPVLRLKEAKANLTYDAIILAFDTDDACGYRIEFGVGEYDKFVQSAEAYWEFRHFVELPGLSPGATVQYRITAIGHRTDPETPGRTATYAGTFLLPPAPTVPPVISDLVLPNIAGNKAELRWTIERPSKVRITYGRAGGPVNFRSVSQFYTTGSAILDLLEPSRSYTVGFEATDPFGLVAVRSLSFSTPESSTPSVTISIDQALEHPISPWIYGINDYQDRDEPPRNLTLNRSGGNRWTAYNWENNASNAGSDRGPYQSDDYLLWRVDPELKNDFPAEAVRLRVAGDRDRKMASLITVQMQGYAAVDKTGVLIDLDDPDAIDQHFKQVRARKGAAFSDAPDLNDPYVYSDEFLWTLRGKFPGDIYTDPASPTFVSLDNEPDLWFYTHAEIQKTPAATDEYIHKTIELATALKDLDPGLQLFGPAHYGFAGIQSFQGQPGFARNFWFTDKYLSELKAASESAGRRLLDVYDIHWYSSVRWPGAKDDQTVTSLQGSSLTDEQIQAVVQSPRSLWDTTFDEYSWITRDYLLGPIYLLPRLQAKIDAIWPGTRIAVTEYENGGGAHIAGAVAQADNLGIFGWQNVFAATLWPLSDYYPFLTAAFKMYRDYDGARGTFGNVSLSAKSSAIAKATAYVSRDSNRSGRYVIVAINRSFVAEDVAFRGLNVSGQARVFRLAGITPNPAFVGEVPVNLPEWVVSLPPLSVTTIELTAVRAGLRVGKASDPAEIKLLVQGTPGRSYAIFSSADLTAWQTIRTVTLNSPEIEVTMPALGRTAFYQLNVVP